LSGELASGKVPFGNGTRDGGLWTETGVTVLLEGTVVLRIGDRRDELDWLAGRSKGMGR
jgi:hypothetical protein